MPAVIEWLGDEVLESNRAEQAAGTENIKRLKTRYEQIEARIETMYMDKIDGRIRQELFDRQTASMRREQDVYYAGSKISRKPCRLPWTKRLTCSG